MLSCVVRMSGSDTEGAVLLLRSRDRTTRAVLRCLWACDMADSAFVKIIYFILGWKQTVVNSSYAFMSHILSFVQGLVGNVSENARFICKFQLAHWRYVDTSAENVGWSTYPPEIPKSQ